MALDPEAIKKISEGFTAGHRMTHAAVVVTAAAILDQALERALKTQMPGLTKNLAKKLFDDFGPLSSFAAKIDLAHALGITSDFVHAELGKIRKMRNLFSHSEKLLSLDTEPVKTLFYALKRPPGVTGNYPEQFMACVLVLDNFLEKFLFRMGMTQDLSFRWMEQKEEIAPDAGAKEKPLERG
jgi:hypothetical protein